MDRRPEVPAYVGSGSLFIHIHITMVQQDLQVAKTIVKGAGRLVINVVYGHGVKFSIWGEVRTWPYMCLCIGREVRILLFGIFGIFY